MNIEIFAEGKPIVKADVDIAAVMRLIAGAAAENPVAARSAPATPDQMTQLLASVGDKNARFLREIAANPSGSISWERMQEIFEIEDRWAAFSGTYGRGITKAFRSVTGSKTAKLVWWDDDEWEEAPFVYIDGEALKSLRAAL